MATSFEKQALIAGYNSGAIQDYLESTGAPTIEGLGEYIQAAEDDYNASIQPARCSPRPSGLNVSQQAAGFASLMNNIRMV